MKQKTIRSLWDGTFCAQEICRENDPISEQLGQDAEQILDQLKQILSNKEQGRLLSLFVDAMTDMANLREQNAFGCGLTLGMRLACEAWSGDQA